MAAIESGRPWPIGPVADALGVALDPDAHPEYTSLMSNNTPRFELIMATVDAWAEEHAVWYCRGAAEAEVCYILDRPYYAAQMTDDEIAQDAIKAWQEAE
jgi:hypothetical protein